jgi:hypothetical protein
MLRETEIPPEQQTAPIDPVCGMAVDLVTSDQTEPYSAGSRNPSSLRRLRARCCGSLGTLAAYRSSRYRRMWRRS